MVTVLEYYSWLVNEEKKRRAILLPRNTENYRKKERTSTANVKGKNLTLGLFT